MEDLDLRMLRMFTLLARTSSYTRTASLMHVTQSAVSHAMRRLEDQLGCSLLHKKGKTTHLTSEGRIFLTQAQKVLEAAERATDSVTGRFSESRGTLHVVLSTSMAHLLLAPVFREFRESYPNISIVVRLEDTPRAMDELENGRCDLAIIVENQPTPPGIQTHTLFTDQLHLVYAPFHPWSRTTRIGVRELSKEHFLLYQRRSLTFRKIESFFLQTGVQLSSYVEIPSFEIIKQLARLSLGVAVMAPWVAKEELREGSLLSRPLPRRAVKRKWVVARQSIRNLRQPEQTFIGLCRLAANEAIQESPTRA